MEDELQQAIWSLIIEFMSPSTTIAEAQVIQQRITRLIAGEKDFTSPNFQE